MVIVTIDAWKGLNPEQKKKWIDACTQAIAQNLNVAFDDIVIIIRDIELESWGQAGTVGTDPDWLVNSRLRSC